MTMFISCVHVQYCHEQMYYFHYCFSVVPWYQERYILSIHVCSSYRELNMLIRVATLRWASWPKYTPCLIACVYSG